jgi:anthranilate phosphoribosyltransferase
VATLPLSAIAGIHAVGYKHGIVAYGNDSQSYKGMNELSVTGETVFIEFSNGTRNKTTIHPEDVGLPCSPFQEGF